MRVISTPVKELQIQCENCKTIIGYLPFEVHQEWNQCPWDEYVTGYSESIKCPICHKTIIIKNEVYGRDSKII